MSQTPATPKQLDYLLALINRLEGSACGYLSQTRWIKERGTMRERSGQISKAKASAWIDEIKQQLGEGR